MSGTVVLSQLQQNSLTTSLKNGHTEEQNGEREAELIEFDSCSKGLGIKICGGCSRDGREEYGIFIKRILPGGLADIDGHMQQGDQILEVNGESFEGVTNERAVSILRQASATNHVEMVVTRDQQAKYEFMDILEKQNGISYPCTPIPAELQQSRTTTPSGFQQSRTVTPSGLGKDSYSIAKGVNTNSMENLDQSPRHSPRPGHTSPQFSLDEHVVPNGHVSNSMLNDETLYNGKTMPVMTNGRPSQSRPSRPQHLYGKGMIPSMSSTPQSGGTIRDQRMHSLSPMTTLSPVQDFSFVSGYNNSVFSSQSLPRPNRPNVIHKTRKLSLDPTVRLKIQKLEVALRYLGLNPTHEQEAELRQRMKVDSAGTVNYGDFVAHARDIFKQELIDKNIDPRAMLFAASDIKDMLEPPSFRPSKSLHITPTDTIESLAQERHQLLQEIQKLKQKLHESDAARLLVEDEMLDIKKKAQVAIDETYSLRKKVNLAERAQRAARDMEHDYEEVVHLLEGEIAKLKAQEGSHTDDVTSQQKISLLNCQLKKCESEKRMYEVATEKLLQFAENIHETFSGQPSRQALSVNPGMRKRLNPKNIAVEAKEIIQAVITLIETEPLPYGWEEAYTEDGLKYFINHMQQITTWTHPRSGIQQGKTQTKPPDSSVVQPASDSKEERTQQSSA